MSVSQSTSTSKARKSPRGGKAATIAKEMEKKRAPANYPTALSRSMTSEERNNVELLASVSARSFKIDNLLRFHRLEDIAIRMWGCSLGDDVFIYICDDGRTIRYSMNDAKVDHVIGVLPQGYLCCELCLNDGCEFNGYWVGTEEDIGRLKGLVEERSVISCKIDKLLCGEI